MKMPPEVLRLSGGFFCDYDSDFQATLVATMACDYDFQKMAFDYDPLTCPLVFPTLPCRKSSDPCPLPNSGPDRRCLPPRLLPVTPRAYAAKDRHTVQDGTKSRMWCSLPRLENGHYKPCTALAIAELCAAYSVTALESPHKPIIWANGK